MENPPTIPNTQQPQQPINHSAYNQGPAYTNNPYQQRPQQPPQYAPSPSAIYNNAQMGNNPQYHFGYPGVFMDTRYIEEQMLELLKIICEEYTNNKKLEEIAKASKKNKAKEIDIDLRIKKLNTEIENEARKLEIMYEDRLNGIISAEEYQKNAKNVKEKVTKLQNDIKELEAEKANGNIKKQDDKLDNLVQEFLKKIAKIWHFIQKGS